MNETVEQIQKWYRDEREKGEFNVIVIDEALKKLAENGLVWIVKDLKGNTDAEEIVINAYINKYRGRQIYDDLENVTFLPLESPDNILSNTNSSKNNSSLQIRDITRFNGYTKAQELEERIIEITKEFPSYETKQIVDQINRSAESIKKRIYMGEQSYVGVKFNQYSYAIGSAKETSAWLQISLDQGYITQKQHHELNNLITQVVCILTKSLSNIKENEGKGMDLPNVYTPNVNNFKAYTYSLILVRKVYELTNKREYWNKKRLVSSIREYSTSIAANIAESNQLYTSRKFQFFNNTIVALNGLESVLESSLSSGIILKKDFLEINKLRISVRNILTTTMGNMSGKKYVKR
ncbi:four helix bundle protein [Oceanobacillus sp. 1P07AA]|uniref:four helix bundle protein n=1 Tax=Oceanobacillus sp. 1P07AA TaxID=3132293 RepID=UPI0039A66852